MMNPSKYKIFNLDSRACPHLNGRCERSNIIGNQGAREEALVELKRRQATMGSIYIRSRSSPGK